MKLAWAGLLAIFMLSGFTCEKNRYYEVTSQSLSCSEISLNDFETSEVSLWMEKDVSYCTNATRFSYGSSASIKDSQIGLILLASQENKCSIKFLIVAPPEGLYTKTKFDPVERAARVAEIISKQKPKLKLSSESPRLISEFKDYCEKM